MTVLKAINDVGITYPKFTFKLFSSICLFKPTVDRRPSTLDFQSPLIRPSVTLDTTNMAHFRDLPVEILHAIVGYLGQEDAKRVRLICRNFTSVSLSALFRSVAFSHLRRDKEILEEIAARPHIAQHIRELVYYEHFVDN